MEANVTIYPCFRYEIHVTQCFAILKLDITASSRRCRLPMKGSPGPVSCGLPNVRCQNNQRHNTRTLLPPPLVPVLPALIGPSFVNPTLAPTAAPDLPHPTSIARSLNFQPPPQPATALYELKRNPKYFTVNYISYWNTRIT